MIDGLRFLKLFRRHVVRRPHHVLCTGQGGVARRQSDHLCDAEIGDFHPALFIHQDVFRFDVAVNDAFIMRKLKRFADLRNDDHRLFGRKSSRLLHLAQIGSVNELHQQVGEGPRLAEVVNRHDVGMVQTRQSPRFAVEPFGEARATRHRRGQYFQCHQPVQLRLSRLVNRSHAALAEKPQNFEPRKKLLDLFHRRRQEAGHGGLEAHLRLLPAGKAGFHQALRAKSHGHVRRQRLLATRTNFDCFHVLRLFYALLRNPSPKVAQ